MHGSREDFGRIYARGSVLQGHRRTWGVLAVCCYSDFRTFVKLSDKVLGQALGHDLVVSRGRPAR